MHMPNRFSSEGERSKKFQEIVTQFFASDFPPLLFADYSNAQPGASILHQSGAPKLIIKYKNETGHAGNIYMHASRSFDAIARSRPIADQNQTGCPAFVVCVEGGYNLS
jgi:hypothetical protein